MFADFKYQAAVKWDGALLAALGQKDIYTKDHSGRVSGIGSEIGRKLGFSTSDMHMLLIAAALHDVGKIGIPDSVLLKMGKLDNEEWAMMKDHSEKGESIFKALEVDTGDPIAAAIRSHHEYYNGQGYPDGLAGEDIPILSRVIAIADSYDAMTIRRIYRNARSHRQTMDIILSESGTKFDPCVVSAFTKIIEHSEYKVA